MKKTFLLTLLVACSTISMAQKGNNQIGIGAEVGFPVGDFHKGYEVGFGGSAKALFGVGRAGQVSFTTGYSDYDSNISTSDFDIWTGILPFLLGYRHKLGGFYLEPQAGYGIYNTTRKALDEKVTTSNGAFTWAIGLGYALPKGLGLDVSARYQSGHENSSTTALIGVCVGYNFSLGSATGTRTSTKPQ